MKTLFIISLTLLTIFQASSFAWDNNVTHPGITNKAVDYLTNTLPTYNYLQNYAHFNIVTKNELTCLDEGSVKEDYTGVASDWDTTIWGANQDPLVPSLSFWQHGYHPITGESWYGLPDYRNAFDYSADIWTNITSSQNPYFHIGRFCHLMEDMTSVAHANADQHTSCDDLEEYSKVNYSSISYTLQAIRQPSTHGLAPITGCPHPDLRANSYANFIKNVVWRAYYMSTYYGGTLVLKEGNYQPDSELKRMFPYNSGTGLRYDDGGWFYNDSWRINAVGYFWIGYGIGNNSDWWSEESGLDPKYYYLENIDGDYNVCNGPGAVPAVFKIDKTRRILSTDNLSNKLVSNTKTLNQIYTANSYLLAAEWSAGFIKYATDTIGQVP